MGGGMAVSEHLAPDEIAYFDTVSGARLGRLPASSWSWTHTVGQAPTLTVVIPFSRAWREDYRARLAPWAASLGLIIPGGIVRACGPIVTREWDSDSQTLSLTCGGVLDILKKRLVMPSALKAWTSGSVSLPESGEGETQPIPAKWRVDLDGSLADIAVRLVQLATTWGPLPISFPELVGGGNQRTYSGLDLQDVATRLQELSDVIDGPEIRFAPILRDDRTRLEYEMEAKSPELVPARHWWDARRSATPITGLTVTEDGAEIVGDGWAVTDGDGHVLVARRHDTWLEDAGYPLLQAVDASRTSVKNLSTLEGYAAGLVRRHAYSPETIKLSAARWDGRGETFGEKVTAGDHVNLRVDDPYLGDKTYRLKVLTLSGDEGDHVTLQCREVQTDE